MSKLYGIRIESNGDLVRSGPDGRLQTVATPLDFGLDRLAVVTRGRTTLLPRRPLPGNLPLHKVMGHTTSGHSITVADIEMVWNDRRFINAVYAPHDAYSRGINEETAECLRLADELYDLFGKMEVAGIPLVVEQVHGTPANLTTGGSMIQ